MSIPVIFIAVLAVSCNNSRVESNSNNDSTNVKNPKMINVDSSTANAVIENSGSDKSLTLADFMKSAEKKSKTYSISNSRDEVIKCPEGTIVKVKANSFVYEDGSAGNITDVELEIKEYVRTPDMLLSGLSTTSNGRLLETNGMLDIKATSKNKKLKLKNNAYLKILFPIKENKTGMKLFTGNRTPTGVNWVLAKQPEELNSNGIYLKPDEMPVMDSLTAFIISQLRYPKKAKDNNVEGTVFVACIVNATGKAEDPRVLQGLGFGCNEEALRIVNLLPNFQPATIKNKPVKTMAVIPVRFNLTENAVGLDIHPDFSKALESKYADYLDKIITNSDKEEMNYYVFNSKNLGMINCDRFIDVENKTNLLVNQKSDENSDIKIVFKKMKSIMNGVSNVNGYNFYNIPVGEEITIVGLKYQDNQPLVALKKTTISKDMTIDLEYKPVTLRELKTKLEAI